MSASTPWTPGPWVVEEIDGEANYSYRVVSNAYSEETPGICGDHSTPHWPLEQADACLIAAAPELYEALAEIVDLENSDSTGSDFKRRLYIWEARALYALARARGES